LNTKIIDDYLSAIEGYTYDEESQSIANTSENTVKAAAGIKVISGDGTHIGKSEEEVKRSVKISDAAKFDKIFKYLQSGNEDEQIKYYEFLSDDIFKEIYRDDFLEVLVAARFSKMKELTDSVRKMRELATIIEDITDQQLLDKKAKEAVNGFAALEQLCSGKEISCVFNFEDRKFPLVAYLDESYFKCAQDNFVGQSYMLCKVLRKIPKGQNIKLDEIFDDVKKLPLKNKEEKCQKTWIIQMS
jgi:hypothetical protein